MKILEEIEKGIIIEIRDVKQAINVNEFANAVLIRKFDLELIEETKEAISIPIIASCKIGHFVEAKLLEKVGVAMIDESNESDMQHMNKKEFSIPFMCKVKNAEEIKERVKEGAKAIRTEFGDIGRSINIIKEMKNVMPTFTSASIPSFIPSLRIATPADISLLFKIGCHSIIISSDLFRSPNPPKLLEALAKAARYYNEIDKIFSFSKTINKIIPKTNERVNND